ncbi:MAG: amidase family protein [Acidimicrobiales bacterium]
MDAEDLAFAGIAEQARLIRAGSTSSRELVEVYLDRIDRLDRAGPGLKRSGRCSPTKRAAASAADDRIAAGDTAPLLGVPVAFKDELDLVGRVANHGTAAYDTPATANAVHVQRILGAGRSRSAPPTCRSSPFAGSPRASPPASPATPGTPIARRAGRAAARGRGRGRARRCGVGQRRSRLDPDPRGAQRSVRSEAPARPYLADARGAALARHVGDRLPHPARGRRRAVARRDAWSRSGRRPRAPAPRSRISLPRHTTRPAAHRRVDGGCAGRAPPIIDESVAAAMDAATTALTRLGHRVAPCAPEYGSAGNPMIALYLRGVRSHLDEVPHPERLERRTRGFGRLGRAVPDRVFRAALRDQERHVERINGIFDEVDVLVTPVTGTAAVEVERWQERVHCARCSAWGGSIRTPRSGTTPANRRRPSRSVVTTASRCR